MIHLTRKHFLLMLGGLAAVAQSSYAQKADFAGLSSAVAGKIEDPAAPVSDVLAALAAERQMLVVATMYAADDDVSGAWKILTNDVAESRQQPGVSADRLGWRTATVTGFLINQGKRAAANRLARLALTQSWSRAAGQSEEVSFWCAKLAIETLNDRKEALRYLGSAKAQEKTRVKDLREALQAAEKAFPGRG